MNNLVGQQIDHYRIEALLGQGGMGEVYRAVDVNLDRPVALKVMHGHLSEQGTFQDRFMQEARAAARLNHPSIVNVYHFGQGRDYLYMVMALVTGPSLGKYIRLLMQSGKVIELRETMAILAQVADALGYAHRQGVVHRDIKPDNILLKRLDEPLREGEPPLQAMVTDFGLAKLREGGVNTATGTIMGTLPYMSPEQVLGADLDGRSDLYSLGVMLYQMATGRLPFDIKTPTDAVMKHMNELPPPPRSINPGLPAKVEAVIQKSIAKKPDDRFPTGMVMARALRAAAQDLTAAEVTSFAAPSSIVSLMTRLEDEVPVAAPSRLGHDLTAPPGQYQLIIARQGEEPRAYDLDKETFLIGRTNESDVVLNVPGISRQHAKIERVGESWQVTDLNSTNGTFLGDHRLLAGVPEPWPAGQSVRVGPYHLHWRKAAVGSAPDPSRRPGTFLATQAEGGLPPGATSMQSSSGQLSVVLRPTEINLAPGERVEVQVELLNSGVAVDHYRLQVEDLPADWVTLPQESLQLMPGARGVLSFSLHPPRQSTAAAGLYRYRLQVQSTLNAREVARIPGQVMITPFIEFASDIRPTQVSAGESVRVLVHNRGNAQGQFRVSGRDPGDDLTFALSADQLTIPAGERQMVNVDLAPKQRALFGKTRTAPFQILVQPAGGEPQAHNGTVAVNPRLPGWLPPLFMALFAFLCVAISLAAFFFRGQNQSAAATATAQYVAALTVTAATDADGDGLGLQAELALGTDPLNADTDGDGLNDGAEEGAGANPLNPDSDGDGLKDGDEVSFGSNPQVVDSDGDTVPDGVEVEQGTSPINPDTDGDGLNDNVDPDPGQQPTFTPTPTVTATPTITPEPITSTPTATATATATATPSPVPTKPPLLAYVDAGNLWVTELVPDGLLMAAAGTQQLTFNNNTSEILISPDGEKIAMTNIFFGSYELAVVTIETGEFQSLVAPADLYVAPEWDVFVEGRTRLIGSFFWAPDSESIYFNTYATYEFGGEQLADIWTVTLDGALNQVFAPQTAGNFAVAPDGSEVLVATHNSVFRTDMQGFRETLFTFDTVATYSEYLYRPQPVWAADGSAAFVSIPSPDPLAEDSYINLWRIPAGGAAQFLNELPSTGFSLGDQVLWSPDGSHIARTRRSEDNSVMNIFLGDGDGTNFSQYGGSAPYWQLYEWSPDSSAILYADAGDGFYDDADYAYGVGELGQAPALFAPGIGMFGECRWLTNDLVVLSVPQTDSTAVLIIANRGGTRDELAYFDVEFFVEFDVWSEDLH